MHGIPHEKFLREWSDEDRAKALATMRFEAQICHSCGTSKWEWDEDQGGSRHAYEPIEEICPGCERKDWLRDDTSSKRRPGRFITLRRTEDLHG